jgi:hypothetical protein
MISIPLSDYVGYIFSEMVRAREIADLQSKTIAEYYAKDPVLSHFSVPRFKIPEMNLTIPVIMSGVKFNTTYRFILSREKFEDIIDSQLDTVHKALKLGTGNNINDIGIIKDIPIRGINILPPRRASSGAAARMNEPLFPDLLDAFYKDLHQQFEVEKRNNLITIHWAKILDTFLTAQNLKAIYKAQDPEGKLFQRTKDLVISTIAQHTVVDRVKIENLLVNPQTDAVRLESDENSVFQVKARILEDGVFIKTVIEDGREVKVVDFE